MRLLLDLSLDIQVGKIMTFMGMDRVETASACAGDIVALSGVELPRISDTWTDVSSNNWFVIVVFVLPMLFPRARAASSVDSGRANAERNL